jgi:hypothetical protein
MMPRSAVIGLLALAVTFALGCRGAHDDTARARVPEPADASVATASDRTAAIRDAAQQAPDDADAGEARYAPDDSLGHLIARMSESPGDFPSENYVTNEASLLDVAAALRDPKLHDRGYVGVGPEQSYTYLAMLEPRVAYIVDIRRGNLLEHMMFRGCFEAGKTRAEFLTALLARRVAAGDAGADVGTDTDAGADAGFAPLDAAFRAAPPDPVLCDEGIARTKSLLDRLAVAHTSSDDKAIARLHKAFAKHGLGIAYTMLNSGRQYPRLGETLSARDRDGKPASFLASEDLYARVRRLVVENRVIPVVGDFGGKHALRAVAEDMRARGVKLGVFYTSNVEQYLFEQNTYGAFVESVRAMPRDDDSLMVRVWFDAGKPHPAQRPGLRTTQLTIPANAFLARAAKKPFLYYWDVVNQTAE